MGTEKSRGRGDTLIVATRPQATVPSAPPLSDKCSGERATRKIRGRSMLGERAPTRSVATRMSDCQRRGEPLVRPKTAPLWSRSDHVDVRSSDGARRAFHSCRESQVSALLKPGHRIESQKRDLAGLAEDGCTFTGLLATRIPDVPERGDGDADGAWNPSRLVALWPRRQAMTRSVYCPVRALREVTAGQCQRRARRDATLLWGGTRILAGRPVA